MMPFSVKNMHIRIVTHTHTHKLILLQREERSKTCYSMQAKWPGWDSILRPNQSQRDLVHIYLYCIMIQILQEFGHTDMTEKQQK